MLTNRSEGARFGRFDVLYLVYGLLSGLIVPVGPALAGWSIMVVPVAISAVLGALAPSWQTVCRGAAIVCACRMGVLAIVCASLGTSGLLFDFLGVVVAVAVTMWTLFEVLVLGAMSRAIVSAVHGAVDPMEREARAIRRAAPGTCYSCGYCLDGLTGDRCPECGTVVPAGLPRRRGASADVPKVRYAHVFVPSRTPEVHAATGQKVAPAGNPGKRETFVHSDGTPDWTRIYEHLERAEKQRRGGGVALRANPTCQDCGYSLIGLESAVCPECGSGFDPLLLEELEAREGAS